MATYSISERNGWLFAHETNQPIMEINELQSLINNLQATINEARKNGISIHELYFHALRDRALKAIHEAEWIFPNHRSDTWQSGACAYFVCVNSRPNEIKIGCSTKLSQRVSSIGVELKSKARAIAFVKTPQYREAEQFFHYSFSQYRTDGEWFHREPIIQYLERVKLKLGIAK